MMVSFCAVLLPRDVLDEILDLIESVSGGFPTTLPFWFFGDFRCGVSLFIIILVIYMILLLAVPRRFFDDFRCGVLLFMVILVIYKYKNR